MSSITINGCVVEQSEIEGIVKTALIEAGCLNSQVKDLVQPVALSIMSAWKDKLPPDTYPGAMVHWSFRKKDEDDSSDHSYE